MKTYCFLVLINLINPIIQFDYERNGPDSWFIKYPSCKGKSQSPINIAESTTVYDASLKPFRFLNYGQVFNWTVIETNYSK